jgi:hypothetical protein
MVVFFEKSFLMMSSFIEPIRDVPINDEILIFIADVVSRMPLNFPFRQRSPKTTVTEGRDVTETTNA